MDHRNRYEQWLNNLAEDDPLRAELISLGEGADNEAEIEDRFHQDLSFGTAGLRGKVGAGTNRMNRLTVGRTARGIGDLISSKGNDAMKRGVVIAYEPRHYSEEFCRLSAGILATLGIRVFVFDDIRPTPQLAYMIRKLGTICGINVTASHNPKEYNGYKIYWEDGCQVSSDVADEMAQMIEKVDMWESIPDYDYDALLEEGMITVLDRSYDRDYLDRIESLAIHEGPGRGESCDPSSAAEPDLSISTAELDLSIPIVYTPLNGCGALPFSQMLEDRGFTNWMMVPEQTDPDPDFSTVGYPNPEDPKAFALSEKYGHQMGAQLLMATDPDADRFAIEILDDGGNYLPLNGNQTGYILVSYILEGLANHGQNQPADQRVSADDGEPKADTDAKPKYAMVRSIVTSTLSDVICRAHGVEMFETLTGFKNICGKIPWLEEHGYTYLLGYEESIGYAPCVDIRDKDGISTGMLIAEAAAYYRAKGKTLWDALQDIYETYGYYAEDAHSIVLDGISGRERILRMMAWIRENTPAQICGIPIKKTIDYIDGHDDIPPQNAIKIFLDNESWIAIRPSGTEPKIKFYFYSVQASREDALAINSRIRDEIIELIQSVD